MQITKNVGSKSNKNNTMLCLYRSTIDVAKLLPLTKSYETLAIILVYVLMIPWVSLWKMKNEQKNVIYSFVLLQISQFKVEVRSSFLPWCQTIDNPFSDVFSFSKYISNSLCDTLCSVYAIADRGNTAKLKVWC